ncbi:hypothetical protein CcCBS67573_g07255 [Chytriomyces confervae]|uniref:Zn(2)-C6 fungal-type domain-containing protein n=1 Tax=Chytriomyces confervae TaxID=246404 RepID=A0A507EYL1_9FUNG|nr:hypothetical protein CcCBS67573_g07255 [Chytriomyces confervae]
MQAAEERHSRTSSAQVHRQHLRGRTVPGAGGDLHPAAGASQPTTQRRRQVPCEACRTYRKKCDSLEPGSACSRCVDLGIECAFDTSRKPYARRSLPKNGDTAAKTEPEVGESVKVDPQKLLCCDSSLLRNIPTLGLATPPAAHEDTPSQPAHQDTPPGNPARDSNRRPLPCDCCRQQKKKCDRLQPSCSSCKLKGLRCEYINPTKKVPREKSQTKKDEGSETHSNVSFGPTPPPPVLVEKLHCADASVTSSKMSVSFMLE